MNNNHLRLPNKFQLMRKDEVLYEFENKVGKFVGTPSIGKTGDWSWEDFERWARLRTIPDGYPSTMERLARFDITEYSLEAQLVVTRGVNYFDFFWLRFNDSETFDNLPHKRSANFPILPDTEGITVPTNKT